MNNPWVNLPLSPPYFLQDEKRAIDEFNSKVDHKFTIRPELIPEAYLGDPTAPVVLLNKNPGFDDREIRFHNDDEQFIKASRANLLHEPLEYPFYLLDPALKGSLGQKWWMKRLKAPIKTTGIQIVSKKLFCVEYFPYHSDRFKPMGEILRSQQYSFYLVREALQREALVILMRAQRWWFEALPQLRQYPRLYQLNDPMRALINSENCPTGYEEMLKYLHPN